MNEKSLKNIFVRDYAWRKEPLSFFGRIISKIQSIRHLTRRHNSLRKFVNFCIVEIEKILKREHLISRPYSLYVDPTNFCNLRCPLCATGQGGNFKQKGKLELFLFRKIIDELSPYLYNIRLFNWGEPFLNEQIFEMIAYATQKNIGTIVSSNFNIFNSSNAHRLIDSGLDHLIISLDGTTQAVYEKYRVGGDLNKVLENIRMLVSAKKEKESLLPFIEIQFLVMRHNEHQIDEMKEIASDLGVNHVSFVPIFVNVKSKKQREKWLPSNPEFSRYSYIKWQDKFLQRGKTCDWLYRLAVMDWDGTVLPCCHYTESGISFGSISEKSFRDVWNGHEFTEGRRVFSCKMKNRDHICGRCKGMPTPVDEKYV